MRQPLICIARRKIRLRSSALGIARHCLKDYILAVPDDKSEHAIVKYKFRSPAADDKAAKYQQREERQDRDSVSSFVISIKSPKVSISG